MRNTFLKNSGKKNRFEETFKAKFQSNTDNMRMVTKRLYKHIK